MKSNCFIRCCLIISLGLILGFSCSKEDAENQNDITYGTVKDIDGNVYKTITIDFSSGGSAGLKSTSATTQTWMVENLKTKRYSNGDLIETTTSTTLYTDNASDPEIFYQYQWAYAGNESIADTYGRLYTWMTVMDSRNVCPEGWHVPTKAEWSQLAEYLGGKFVDDHEGHGYWSAVGGKLKEAGTTHWESPNTGAKNTIGFTALPGGYSFSGSNFSHISKHGEWWSSTEDLNRWYRWAWTYTLGSQTAQLWVNTRRLNSGLSVRCIK
ncbi:MAG: fibrobacter succinogenes major paralogous domain-containing protein [Bacteroidota bacterium]